MEKILKVCLAVVLLWTSGMLYAQRPGGGKGPGGGPRPEPMGVVKGQLSDSISGDAVQYATVTLIRLRDTTMAGGGITNESGQFHLTKLRPGRYRLHIDFMGYRRTTVRNIRIKPPNWEVDLGALVLAPDMKLLDGVEITAERSFMETAIDRRIYNVDQIGTTKGASAEEVLQTIPSVEVDIDGNVSLRGSGNVTILIDGKPSGLTGSSRQAAVDQIPADAIERVEVITNPSAKFDPDGMAGIINIVLKKNRRDGLTGNVSLGVGTREKYNASAGIAYKTGKVNLYANYSFRYDKRFHEGSTYRENYLFDSTSYLDQYSYGDRLRHSQMIRGGFDWYQSEKNTITLSGRYNYRPRSSEDSIQYRYLNEGQVLTSSSQRSGISDNDSYSYSGLFRWRRDINKAGRNLIFDLSYGPGEGQAVDENQQLDYWADGSLIDNNINQQNTYTSDLNDRWRVQLDYVHPFGDKAKLELGAQSTLRTVDNDFRSESWDPIWSALLSDTALNNRFLYEEDIHAAYAIYGRQFGKVGIQAGLRAEQAFTTSTLVLTDEVFENDYFSLYPSAHLNYELKKNRDLQLSYSRRVNRPRSRTLNPFYSYTDALNLRVGNPFLLPEYIDSYEISYVRREKKVTLTSAVYYKVVHDMIQRIKTVDTLSGVSTTSYQNLSSAENFGLELIGSGQLTEKTSLNGSANFFRTRITDGSEGELNADGYGWNAKLMALSRLGSGWETQVSGRYRSPRPHPQGEISGFYTADVSIKKDILEGKGSLSLRVRDVFNTSQFNFVTSDETFYQISDRKRETRIGYLTFSYRFGKEKKGRRGKRGRGEGGESTEDGGNEELEID